MPSAQTYREAAQELRREARAARDPSRRNRLWEYALAYEEYAAAALHAQGGGKPQRDAAGDRAAAASGQ